MIELIRTNDLVLISFIEALLKDAGIAHFVADSNMSTVEGTLGVLQRRIMVDETAETEARTLLADAGFKDELRS